jgi:hypothetical protein
LSSANAEGQGAVKGRGIGTDSQRFNAFSGKMDSSLMSGMSGEGMDMSSDPMFRTFNQVLAQGYWYTISAVVGFMVLIRMISFYQTWSR